LKKLAFKKSYGKIMAKLAFKKSYGKIMAKLAFKRYAKLNEGILVPFLKERFKGNIGYFF
jgi:hypothetical protein